MGRTKVGGDLYKYTKRPDIVDVLEDVICDVCGESCKGDLDIYEFSQLSAHWGYASKKDGTYWKSEICEECSDKVKEFIESLGGKVVIHTHGYV